MKKLFTLFFFLLFMTFATSVNAEETLITYDIELTQGSGYNLTTGDYETVAYWTSSNKMFINNATYNPITTLSEILVDNEDEFHHVLFWNDQNQYIGYYNTHYLELNIGDKWLNSYDVNGKFLIPDNAYMFAIQSYNYDNYRDTWEDDVYITNKSIDDLAWSDLSYRDIFEDNNLIDNGDFSEDDTSMWSLNDTYESVVDGEMNIDYNINVNTYLLSSQVPYLTGTYSTGNIWYFSYDYYSTYSKNAYIRFRDTDTDSYSRMFQDLVTIEKETTINYNTLITNTSDFITPYIQLSINYETVAEANLDTVIIDNIYLYDLTDIFSGYSYPSTTEMEEMLEYYNTWKDVQMEWTYREVFDDGNLIDNGTFEDGTIYPSQEALSYNDYSIVDNALKIEINTAGSYYLKARIDDVFNTTDYYFVTTEITHSYNSIVSKISSNTSSTGVLTEITVTEETDVLTYFGQVDYTVLAIYDFNGSGYDVGDYMIVDNIYTYDLTTFNGIDIPDEDDFSDDLDYWISEQDPYLEYYVDAGVWGDDPYLDATDMTTIEIYYYYDYEETDRDFETGLDTLLTNGNLDDDDSKAILAISIMILLGFIVAIASRNSNGAIIITMVILYLTFTILGWFSMWIAIVIALVLILLAIFKIFGGGTSE